MMTAIEVVSQVDREIVAEVTFDSEVHLIGIGVLEVLPCREAERLAYQWNSCAQILLIYKDGICVQRVEPVLVRKVLQTGSSSGRITISSRRLETLERIGCVQVQEALSNG